MLNLNCSNNIKLRWKLKFGGIVTNVTVKPLITYYFCLRNLKILNN